MLLVVSFELGDRLEPKRGLAAALFAEDDGGRGLARIAEELGPGRVVGRADAGLLEQGVGLGVLLVEGVAADSVMFQKLLDLHENRYLDDSQSRYAQSIEGFRNLVAIKPNTRSIVPVLPERSAFSQSPRD